MAPEVDRTGSCKSTGSAFNMGDTSREPYCGQLEMGLQLDMSSRRGCWQRPRYWVRPLRQDCGTSREEAWGLGVEAIRQSRRGS